MSRRIADPRIGEAGRRANRMVPGGRLYSESLIRTFRPPLGPMGDDSLGSMMAMRTEVTNDEVVAVGPYPTLSPPAPPPPPAGVPEQ